MTYIERLEKDIQRVDDAIDFCRSVGDGPADFCGLDRRAGRAGFRVGRGIG